MSPQPTAAPADVSAGELLPVWSAVARVRRRLRLQAAARFAIAGLIVAAGALLVALLLVKLRLVTGRTAWATGIGGGVFTLLLALGGALRRIDPLQVAARIDQSHALRDRLASALQFAAAPAPGGGAGEQVAAALRALAMQDAARAAQGVSPAIAAPWQRPPHLALLAALVAANLLAGVVRLPRFRSNPPPVTPVTTAPTDGTRLIADPELLGPEKEDLAAMLAEAQKQGDQETAAVLQELQKLLQQVERGELTRQEAFARLSELEQRLMQGKDGALEDLKQQLRKAGSELGESKLGKELGQALVKEDLEKAQAELKKLAAQALSRAENSQLSKDKQALAQAFEQAARSLSGKKDPKHEDPKDPSKQKDQWKEQSKNEELTRKLQELRDEERSLKKKLQENPNDQETERRLKKNQRELEQLEHEKSQRDEARRELEQLEKDMERAAAEMQKQLDKMTPEQRQALQDLAKDMDRMADEVRKLQKQQKGRGQGMTMLSSIKTVLRRIARSSGGGGQGQQGQGQGQGQQGKDGKGGKGGQGGAMKDFQKRASGQGQDDEVLVEGEGKGGDGEKQLMLLGEGEGTVLLPGMSGKGGGGPPSGQGPQGQGQPGDGIGNQHDPNMLGGATELNGKRRLTKLTGKEGAGPTRSETILGAAERGFAAAPYRKVYVDYQGVSEQVMSKERVPPGYRFYVKRYFQMIKPRE